ncbi:MAG: ferritin-like domain-containing protein [Chloroflexi bacterium]|nr:ferritin-like domain-containing protein [Chloroflexota bacterium]MBU1746144.1 ferritin-like domain-containing protein [Chloroflexota bacterium]
MLVADATDEHAAVVQYLNHAYAMEEGEMACEIEAIARDEMRHYDWLCEAIVELGGDPPVARGFVDQSGVTIPTWMQVDVVAEERAIAQYREHLAAIDDPGLKRLIQRIIWDEESHRDQFAHFVEKAQRKGMVPPEIEPAADAGRTHEILQQGVEHEYTVILQYLYHSFLMPECEMSRELEMQAINEMQHLGWLAEEMAGLGAKPKIEHTAIDRSQDTPAMLRADIAAERAVEAVYSSQMAEIDDPGLRDLVDMIRKHEVYHAELFGDMLKEVEGE